MPPIDDELKRLIGGLLRPVDPPDPAFLTAAHHRRERGRRVSRIVMSVAVVAVTIGGFTFVRSQVRSGPQRDATSQAPPVVSNGDIAFSDDGDLYAITPDGRDLRQLTSGPAYDTLPSWSPGGDQVVFVRDDGDNYQLAVLDVDGGGVHTITPARVDVYRPAWSPDGEWIAFAGNGISLIKPDGSDLHRITGDGFGAPDNPVWSPDSTKLAFTSNLDDGSGSYEEGWDIYVVDVDGSNLTNLTNTPDPDSSETPIGWLPDGNIIVSSTPAVISSGRDAPEQLGAWLEYTADGQLVQTIREDIVNSSRRLQEPSLSPDGLFVVFDTAREGDQNVWTLELATGGFRQITTAGGWLADWQALPLGTASDAVEDAVESHGGDPPVVTVGSSLQDQILLVQFQLDEMRLDYEASTDESEREVYREQMVFLQERLQELCTSLDQLSPDVAQACIAG